MNKKDLIAMIRKDAKAAGIRFYLGRGANVRVSGIHCSGYFCDDRMMLAAAIGLEEELWYPVLIHEYCHMQQWLEQSPEWMAIKETGDIDVWLNGTEWSAERTRKCVDNSLLVELDCEKRVVEFVKKHDISRINIPEYIQKANAYLYFYRVLEYTRKFYDTDRKPYRVEAVWKNMPDHFNNDYMNISPEMYKLYEDHCL